MNQVVLIIYLDENNYDSLLHVPKNLTELDLWVQAELSKPEYKGKDWDLFSEIAFFNTGVGSKEVTND